MCYINATTREPCYYACEHRNLFCIDRDHMLNIEYNGPKNKTIYGKDCLSWTYVMSLAMNGEMNYQWKWIFQDTRASALPELFSKPMEHNQCLNILTLIKDQASYYKFPGIDPIILKGPICFVNDQDFIVPQPCFRTCEDMSIEKNNCIENATIQTAVYTGFRNHTKTGKPYKRWDERVLDYKVPWEITGPLHNYCRNYGEYEHGPWCYVFDKGVEREACFDVCPKGKTLVRHKEADHNWHYDTCTEHSDCCQ
ncbi:Kringle domain containing protein, partial [Trichuris trichiura]